MANKKILFRGARITHIDQRVVENNCFVKIYVACDLTQAIAEEMGWTDLYTDDHLANGLKSVDLIGERFLEELGFAVNGAKAGLECVATEAKKFQVSRVKGETEDSLETVLRFQVTSTAWKLATEFFGAFGTADGLLTLTCAPEQTKLQTAENRQTTFQDVAQEAEVKEAEEENLATVGRSRTNVLASATHMRKAGLN